MARWIAPIAVCALLVSCVGADPSGETQSTVEEEVSPTSTSPGSSSSSTTIAAQQIPAGPYYLPADLPVGWDLSLLRYFTGPHDGLSDGEDSGVETVSFIVHRADGGFGGGAVTLTVQRFTGDILFRPDGLGFGDVESVEIPGVGSAQVEYDDEQTGFGSVSAEVDERTTLSAIGDVSRDELIDIAGAVRIGDSNELEVEIELAGWVAAPRGEPGETYTLGLRGPEGTLEVIVSPGLPEASLHLGGSDFESALEGDVGYGFYAVQRVESANLEFPSVHWWVPDAQLISSVGPDLDLIARILDGFTEVDEAAFRAAVATVPVEVIDIEPAPERDQSQPESEPLDPEVLARLVAVVETAVGREFDEPPSVSIAGRSALQASVPDGAFVSEGLWNVLLALGLVDDGDSRADADAARREQLRGVCCPVTIVDTGNPLFNEVVIVHELTHGLDTDLGSSGNSAAEIVNPVVALVEGNAHRVAFDYADVLNEGGANIPPPPNLFPPGGDPRVPPAVQRILEFPYQQGREFAVAIADDGGEAAIVDAFRQPPSSTEQIMNPDAYLRGDNPERVETPNLPSGATLTQQGTIGVFVIKLTLEQVLDDQTANELSLAWSGDTYILYQNNNQQCLAATINFDNPNSAQQTAEALRSIGVQVTTDQETVRITSCS